MGPFCSITTPLIGSLLRYRNQTSLGHGRQWGMISSRIRLTSIHRQPLRLVGVRFIQRRIIHEISLLRFALMGINLPGLTLNLPIPSIAVPALSPDKSGFQLANRP